MLYLAMNSRAFPALALPAFLGAFAPFFGGLAFLADLALDGATWARRAPPEPFLVGKLDEAETTFSQIAKYSDRQKLNAIRPVLLATAGLIRYRRGDVDQGRELYTEAMETAERKSDRRVAAKAASFLALEEICSKRDFAQAVEQALDRGKEFTDVDFQVIRQRIAGAMRRRAEEVATTTQIQGPDNRKP
jgi:hypothetical protein